MAHFLNCGHNFEKKKRKKKKGKGKKPQVILSCSDNMAMQSSPDINM